MLAKLNHFGKIFYILKTLKRQKYSIRENIHLTRIQYRQQGVVMKFTFLGLVKTIGLSFFFIFSSYIHARESLNQQSKLTIGTLFFNPPFEINTPNKNIFSGFEIDIMNAICARMNVTCEFVAMPKLIDVFNALDKGKIDLVVGAIIILNDDIKNIFSLPYLVSSVQFFVRKNSKINSITDVMNSKIGTINDPLIEKFISDSYAKKHPLIVYDDIEIGIDALDSGAIDALALQTPSTNYWISITNNIFKLIGHPVPIGFGNGIMSKNSSTRLMQQVDEALRLIQKDGTYGQIYTRYNVVDNKQ